VTKARQRANKANAQKSTGPRTAEGKARSSQNAARHGLSQFARLATVDDHAEEAQDLVSQFREAGVNGEAAALAAQAQIGLQRIAAYKRALLEEAQDRRLDSAPPQERILHLDGALADIAKALQSLDDVERRLFTLRRKALAQRQ
jgi:hypothetical protein